MEEYYGMFWFLGFIAFFLLSFYAVRWHHKWRKEHIKKEQERKERSQE
jgi:uncharacterized membrane protein